MKKWYRDGWLGQPEIWEEGTAPPYERPLAIIPQLSGHPQEKHEKTEQLALLITALPDLHDACELAHQNLQSFLANGCYHLLAKTIQTLQEALEKAHGSQTKL